MCVRVSQSLNVFKSFQEKFPIDYTFRYNPDNISEDVTAFKQRLVIVGSRQGEFALQHFMTSCEWGEGEFFNARYDSLKYKRFWKDAERVLIPVSGFYEHGKWFNANPDKADMFAIAGVTVETEDHHHRAFVVTRTATRPVSLVHHRMPVIIPEYLWNDWMTPSVKLDRFDKLEKAHFDLIAA